MTKLNNFAEDFIAAQMKMGSVTKDATNPFLGKKYADLNSVRQACVPALNEHGIAVLQPTVHVDGKNFVKTILLHKSGETMESFTEIVYSKANDAQAQGSGITYARRYGLQSLVNIAAEDDDGNAASKKEEQKKSEVKPEPKPVTQKTPLQGLAETADKDLKEAKEQERLTKLHAALIELENEKEIEDYLKFKVRGGKTRLEVLESMSEPHKAEAMRIINEAKELCAMNQGE